MNYRNQCDNFDAILELKKSTQLSWKNSHWLKQLKSNGLIFLFISTK